MRALRFLLVLVVVLGGLFVAADRIAVKLAEDEAAGRIKNAQGVATSGDASVDIQGFPFLTQVAAKDLDQVNLRLDGLKADAGGHELAVGRVDAQLHHVRLGADYSSAVADEATGSAVIPYGDLSDAAANGVSIGYGGSTAQGQGKVKVTGSVQLLGRTIERSVESTVSVSGGDRVKLHAETVPGEGIPGIEDAIRSKIDFERKIGGLPNGLKLKSVEPTPQGVKFSVTGSDVKLTG